MSIRLLIHYSPISCPVTLKSAGKLFLTGLIATALIACGSQPQVPEPFGEDGDASLALEHAAQDYLEQASRVEGSAKIPLLLNAADAYLLEGNPQRAAIVLTDIDLDFIDQQQLAQLHLIRAAGLAQQQQWEHALASLQFPGARQAQVARWHKTSALVQAGLGNPVAAIRDLHRCASLDESSYQLECSNQRWDALLEIEQQQLLQFNDTPQLQAWASLALILRRSSGPIEKQIQAVNTWLTQHPSLASGIPDEVVNLITAGLDIPERIALLLPLSGRLAEAGQAVLDGVLAARFDLANEGLTAPLVDIYDTASEPTDTLADQLEQGEYDLVLGPLDPVVVSELASRLNPELPMLAFNRIEQAGDSAHYGMSLAVESEAAQAARDALAHNLPRALVLVQDSAYGERAASAFSATLQQSGLSSLAGLIRVNDPTALTRSLEQAFHIDQSELRRQQLQGLLGKRLEFSPRRREDIDLIFLASNAGLARQVGPTLAFVFAEDVPVLATSQVYDGQAGAEENRDLGNISFLAPNWALRQSFPLGSPTARNAELQRLEALGYDTLYLGRRLGFAQQSQAGYQGQMAQWHAQADGNFVRTMEWARINGEELSQSDWNR